MHRIPIVVFLTAVVAVFFSMLTGCCSGNQQDEVVRWILAARDTIPEVVTEIEDSLGVDKSVREKSVANIVTPKVKRKPSLPKQKKASGSKACLSTNCAQAVTHSWTEGVDPDFVKLTIIVSGLEMQITQNLSGKRPLTNTITK